MTNYLVKDSSLTAVANAIRAKGGTSEQLTYPNGFVSAIEAIETTPVLQEKTVTPTSSTQNITSDTGYDGLSLVTVAGDSDLIAANIKKNVEIFGVTGTYEEGVKTCTLGIKTVNPNSNTDYVYYYYYNESGMREKTSVYLTTSYQTITFCDGFLAVDRGSGNIASEIYCYDSYDNKVYTIRISDPHGIWIAPTGYMVLNIAFLLEEYPNIEKISFNYGD